MSPARPDPDDPVQALREVRGRFVAAFPRQCDSIAALLAGDLAAERSHVDAARRLVHRLTGLAGTVGFPSVSLRAAELESLLMKDDVSGSLARDLLTGIREAYAADLLTKPEWDSGGDAPLPAAVLIVEDDDDQRELLEIQLQRSGHRTRSVTRGDEAVDAVRDWRPGVVLLDIDLPGL